MMVSAGKEEGMYSRFFVLALVMMIAISFTVTGCKARTADRPVEIEGPDTLEEVGVIEEIVLPQAPLEPAETVAVETIPPTATPPAVPEKPEPVAEKKMDRNREIQTALKAAGFYTGSIDGKIGPKSKEAILDFQKAKGLKADGIVGPRTWAELEKYLVQ